MVRLESGTTPAKPDAPPAPDLVRALRRLLIAAALVPALLFGLAAWQNRQVVIREAELSVRNSTDVFYEHALKVFEAHQVLLEQVDERTARLGWDEIVTDEIQLYLRRLRGRFDDIHSVFLVDAQGIVRVGSLGLSSAGVSVSDRDYFQALEAGHPGIVVGTTQRSRGADVMVYFVAKSRTTADGSFNGAIVLALRPEYFLRFYSSVAAEQRPVISLVRADGAFLVRSPPLAPSEDPNILRRRFVEVVAGRDMGQSLVEEAIVGPARIFGYRRLRGFPIYVVFGLDLDAVMRQWHSNLLTYTVVAVPAMLLLLAVAFVALQRARREALAVARWQGEVARREGAEEALRQTLKMEAVGQLTGGVAHDFNNILAAIITNLELSRETLAPNSAGRRQLDAALKAALNGATVTQRLLAFSRKQPLNPQNLDLNTLIGSMQTLLWQSCGETFVIRTVLKPDLPLVRIDPNQVENALLNLVLNARDAMPRGGTITVRTDVAALAQPRQLASGELAAGAWVTLAVEDTGEGIEAALLPRIFDPFFSTKAPGEGTGLGLSMVYGFVTQTGGAVEVESRRGAGTAMRLYFPPAEEGAVAEYAPAGPPPDIAAPKAAAAPAMVLLVEDDALVRMSTVQMLEQLGCGVHAAASARQALEILERQHGIDLLLTDIGLPDLNGHELAAEARRRRPGLRVIFATGYDATARPGKADADTAWLSKPYMSRDLEQALTRLMEPS